MKTILKFLIISLFIFCFSSCYLSLKTTRVVDKYDNGNVKIKKIKKGGGFSQKITFSENGDTLKVESFQDNQLIESKEY